MGADGIVSPPWAEGTTRLTECIRSANDADASPAEIGTNAIP